VLSDASLTEKPAIFATSHVPSVHPVKLAKQAMTIDHVTGGRFCLSVDHDPMLQATQNRTSPISPCPCRRAARFAHNVPMLHAYPLDAGDKPVTACSPHQVSDLLGAFFR
jgi:alkanesulfonate monooxygenase SsuD/methylene tetrahydromethanopterin reductase-like flavin-dependent oxidoreductase (luciferase family)